jgi:hypothetical protein
VSHDLLYKVAYDEAVRALSERRAEIDSFRSRAGLLFSSAAVAASFLGSQALQGGGTANLASWLALLCFVAVAAASLAILWPRKWEGKANPRDLIETYIESPQPAPIENLHRDLAIHMHNSYMENRMGLEQFVFLLQFVSGLLTLEVILWMIALVITL